MHLSVSWLELLCNAIDQSVALERHDTLATCLFRYRYQPQEGMISVSTKQADMLRRASSEWLSLCLLKKFWNFVFKKVPGHCGCDSSKRCWILIVLAGIFPVNSLWCCAVSEVVIRDAVGMCSITCTSWRWPTTAATSTTAIRACVTQLLATRCRYSPSHHTRSPTTEME